METLLWQILRVVHEFHVISAKQSQLVLKYGDLGINLITIPGNQQIHANYIELHTWIVAQFCKRALRAHKRKQRIEKAVLKFSKFLLHFTDCSNPRRSRRPPARPRSPSLRRASRAPPTSKFVQNSQFVLETFFKSLIIFTIFQNDVFQR